MGNKTNKQPNNNQTYENIPTAEVVVMDIMDVMDDIPIATAYLDDAKVPSAPPMHSKEIYSQAQFMEDNNQAPEPSAPPMPTEMPPLQNQCNIYSDSNSKIEEEAQIYARALRQAIDRKYIALAKDILKTGKLDNVDILTRESDYLNDCISHSKHNVRRLQIKELIEERIKNILNKI